MIGDRGAAFEEKWRNQHLTPEKKWIDWEDSHKTYFHISIWEWLYSHLQTPD